MLAGLAVWPAPAAAAAGTCEGKLDKAASELYKAVTKQIDAGTGTGRYRGKTDWPDLARKLEGLLSDYPRPSHEAHPRHGKVNNQHYLPHYNLGLCRYKSGDCLGALKSFLQAENEGCVVSYGVERNKLRDMRSDCQMRLRGGRERGGRGGPLPELGLVPHPGSQPVGSPGAEQPLCVLSTSGIAAW